MLQLEYFLFFLNFNHVISFSGVEKMVFKALVFYGFLKTKKPRKVGFCFCFFMVFLDIVIFCIIMRLNRTVIISLL